MAMNGLVILWVETHHLGTMGSKIHTSQESEPSTCQLVLTCCNRYLVE